ncbi:hypothetical protein V1511DRAFT_489815 [Dipodascopsis uninucleata]
MSQIPPSLTIVSSTPFTGSSASSLLDYQKADNGNVMKRQLRRSKSSTSLDTEVFSSPMAITDHSDMQKQRQQNTYRLQAPDKEASSLYAGQSDYLSENDEQQLSKLSQMPTIVNSNSLNSFSDNSSISVSFSPGDTENSVFTANSNVNTSMKSAQTDSILTHGNFIDSLESLAVADTSASSTAVSVNSTVQATTAVSTTSATSSVPSSSSSSQYIISIANLPYIVRWQELKDLVKEIIPVQNIVRTEVYTLENNKSQGVGSVKVRGRDAAFKCVEFLDGYEWHSRSLSASLIPQTQMVLPVPNFSQTLPFNSPSAQVTPLSSMNAIQQQQLQLPHPGQPTQRRFSHHQISSSIQSSIQSPSTIPFPYNVQTPDYYLMSESQSIGAGLTNSQLHYQKISAAADSNSNTTDNSSAQQISNTTNTPPQRQSSPQRQQIDKRKVFIGNIRFDTQWQNLKEFVKTGGEVSRIDIITNVDGESKGFAIAVFATEEDADRAIQKLDGVEFESRVLTVRLDKYPDSKPPPLAVRNSLNYMQPTGSRPQFKKVSNKKQQQQQQQQRHVVHHHLRQPTLRPHMPFPSAQYPYSQDAAFWSSAAALQMQSLSSLHGMQLFGANGSVPYRFNQSQVSTPTIVAPIHPAHLQAAQAAQLVQLQTSYMSIPGQRPLLQQYPVVSHVHPANSMSSSPSNMPPAVTTTSTPIAPVVIPMRPHEGQ